VENLKNRYRYSIILLKQLVKTDFKLRYQGSVLGYAWSLLRPLLMFVILYVIFVKVVKADGGIPYFPVYLLLGIVIWNFFVEMTTQSLSAIVGRGELIRKIRIPRWVIIFSISISALINLGLNLIIFFLLMLWKQVPLMDTLFLLPLIIFEVYILALGCALFLSTAYVKFRDVGYIWDVVLQAGFYVTPILYAMSFIHKVSYQKVVLLNPMAQAIQDARYATVSHDAKVVTTSRIFNHEPAMLIPFIIVAVIFIVGFLFFKSQARDFAENI
jgi:ABC-2 type transport system permease protein